jgi:hydroxyacylglutathione hydrolase
MIVERIFTPGLAQVAYLVTDPAHKVAAVIDPRRDVGEYLAWAERHGVRIIAILETHVHADFVSGSMELARRTGAPIYASWLADQFFPYEPLRDGDEVAVGDLRLRALWTPGHTHEHIAFLLINPAHGPAPIALFSGDVLFVGEVGRPDLLGSDQTEELAIRLYYTVMDRLGRLPDGVTVYPGHTAGSSCGKKIGEAPSTTMGQERHDNYAFQAHSRESFVGSVLKDMPKPPTYYPVMKKVNKRGAEMLAVLPEPVALTPNEVQTRIDQGSLLIDARDFHCFGDGHIPGAVAAGLEDNFTAWMGWLAPYDRDLILVLERDDLLDEAATQLHRIGLDRVAGYLTGGMAAWTSAGKQIKCLSQMTAHELAQRLTTEPDGIAVLDVRSLDEWRSEHIAGAIHFYAGEIAQGADPELPADRDIAVICGSGYRSSFAASLLQARDYPRLINVDGGMEAWQEAGLPVVRSEA